MANVNHTALIAVNETEVTSRGQSVTVEWSKLSDDIKGQLMIYGAIQKIGDAASGAAKSACEGHFGTGDFNKADAKAWLESESGKKAAGEEALRMMQKSLDALLAGKWAIRESSGTVEKKTPLQNLVLDMAKAELRAKFEAVCAKLGKKPTFAAFVELSPAVAKYFDTSGKRPVWNDEPVLAYVAAQLANGGRDFESEAKEQLAKVADAAESIDVDDLLDGI